MVGWVLMIIFFFVVISACCSSSDSGTYNNSTTNTRSKSTYRRRNTGYSGSSYSECPSCGAPYFDGYCEECGYPDINQGWIGENY